MKTKQPSDEIFNLVKSFNKAEAGYFIQHINRSRIKEAEEYIQLFKLIRGLEEYKESEVKSSFKNPAFLKRFAYHKTNLSTLVVDSLVAYKSSTSANSRLHRLLEAINFLHEKQQFTYALKLTDKARELALHYEDYFALLEINNWHRVLLKNYTEAKFWQQADNLYLEKKEILEKIENENQMGYLNDKVFALYRELYLVKSPEKKEELEKLMQDPLLSTEKNAITFSARLKFNHLHSVYHQLCGNYEEAFKCRKRILEHWDQNSHMKTEYVTRYLTDLTNVLSTNFPAKIDLDFEDIMSRIENISGGSKEENATVFSEVYYLRQVYMLNNNLLPQALELIPRIEKGLKHYGNAIRPMRRFSFLYNIAITYFMNDKYAEALPCFESIANANRKHEVRTDLREVCSIFRIILLYQTGKHDLVDYAVRNTRDRLKYGNKLYELEQVVLENIPLLIKSKTQKAVFLSKLEELFSRPENKNLLGLEELIIWLKKKL